MSNFVTLDHVPARLEVGALVESRYADNERPHSWDERREGNDIVRLSDGRLLKLFSDGGQSPPKQGWVIMVSSGTAEQGYYWTLYGMPQGVGVPA